MFPGNKGVKDRPQQRGFVAVTFLWLLALSVMAIQPAPLVRVLLRPPLSSSFAHFSGFFILAILSTFTVFFHGMARDVKKPVLFAAAAAFLFNAGVAGMTEWIQYFSPGRNPSWDDFRCDLYGALAGCCVFMVAVACRLLLKRKDCFPRFLPRLRTS